MVDKSKPESNESNAQKSSEELFLRGSETDKGVQKKTDDDKLKLDDSVEELSLQNIQRGSEELEHPNKGVKEKGAGRARSDELDVNLESNQQNSQIGEIDNDVSNFSNSEPSSGESTDGRDYGVRRIYLNLDDNDKETTNSQQILEANNEDALVSDTNEALTTTNNNEEEIAVVDNVDPTAGDDVALNTVEGASSINGQLTSTDPDEGATASWGVSLGSTVPAGFVLNADGSFSFDPADSAYDHINVGDSQVLTIPVTVTDNNGGTDTAQVQITISGTNDAPVAGAAIAANVDEGAATISGQLTSTDVDNGSTASWSASSSPAGFVLNTDGSYTFNPSDSTYDSLTVGDSTILTIPITVTDDNGATDTTQIQITVSGTNDAPVAGAAITANVDEGAAVINGQFTSTDVDAGATSTWSASSAPAGFVLNTDGSYSFDPADSAYDSLNIGDSTVLTIPVTVTDDNGGIDTSQIQITVSGTNDAPVAGVSVTTNVDEGAATINGQLTSTDVDSGSTASWSAGSSPTGFVLNIDGSYSFNPTDSAYNSLNVGDSTVLTIPVTVTDDNGGIDTSQIQITVSGTNDAPVAGVSVTTNVDEGAATVNGQLTSTDVDSGSTATFTISSGNTPDGFVLNADGSYSFNPSDSAYDSLNDGDSTVLTIPVTVTDDNGATDTTQIQITVNGTNDAPVAGVAVIVNVDEGSATVNGQLTATDTDTGSTAAFSVTSSSVPDGFVLNADGSYSFDPGNNAYDSLNVGDSSVLTIPVTVTDENGATDTTQIQITVSGTNDAPIAGVAVTANVDEGDSVINGQLTSSDVDAGSTATFTITSGGAPDGFVLNADGSYSFDPSNSVYDSLNVGDSSVLTVPVTVTDDNGATDTTQIQITVSGTNDAPVASAAVTANVDEGAAVINGQLTSADVDAGSTATFTITTGNTPVGFVLNADGSYSFNPSDNAYDSLNVGDSSVLTIPITVTDDNGATDTTQIQITVSGTNDAPIASADVVATVDEGDTVIGGQFTSSDVDAGATATWSTSSSVSGFTLNTDGSYNFDPADSAYNNLNVGDSTVLTIPVTVTDDNGATDTAQIQITISGTNDAPVAGASVTTSVNEGDATINGQLTLTDADAGATATFTISVGNAPDGFVLNADGSYSFDPSDSAYDSLNVGDSTVLTIPVTVTDDNGASDTSQIQITVSGTNDAPVAGLSITTSVDEGTATINGQLASTDIDVDSTATFTITSGGAPDGFVLNADGSYSFTPSDSAYDGLNVGDSSVLTIPVTVTDDNGATDTTQIQITVSGTNDAPIAGAAVTTSVDEGTASINGQLTSIDVDAGSTAAFTITSGGAPEGFVLNTDGSYSFNPSDSAYDGLNVGDSSVLTIPVTVTDDNGATDTTQIQITVSGTNDVPVASADVVATVDEGDSVINGQFTSSDVDSGATATWSVGSATAGFTLNADGSYSFDPTDNAYDNLNVGDSTVLTIPVTITDDNGATDTSQIQITVSGTNDAPIAGAAVTTSVDEGAASLNGQLTSSDVDASATATFSITSGSAPDGFVLNADGSYSFDPSDTAYSSLNIGDSTVLTIPVTVTDDNGATDTSQIQITVSGTNDAPVAGVDVTENVDEGDSVISGQLTSSDDDAGAAAIFSISSGSAPDGFVLNADGSYSFDPSDNAYDSLNVGDSSVLTIPVTVADDNGATDTSQIQITVSGTNDAPIAGVDVVATVDEGDAVINGQLTSSDVDSGATATWSTDSFISGFTLNTDGSYSFDPTNNSYDSLNVGDSTVLTIPVTVTDDNGATDTSQIQITVSGTNDAPVAGVAVTATVDEGDSVINGQLTSSDVDAGSTATYTISTGSAPDGFVLNTNGSYSFDPSDSSYGSLNIGDSSVLTIPVTVTDENGATDISQIQITVSGTNDAPIAGAAVTTTVDEGDSVVNGQFASADVDAGATATWSMGSAVSGFTLDADGSYSFDPSDSAYDSLNVGDSSVLTIPVTVTDDNGATDTSQIQITVSGTNDSPVAGADATANVNEGDSAINGQLTSNDVDAGSTATYTITSGSAPDGFVLNADGSYSFDPSNSTYDSLNVGDSSVLTIPVTVTDDNGATDTSQIQITVSGTNDAPVAGAVVVANVNEGDSTINGQLTSSDADDGSTASYSVSEGSTSPDGFTLNADGSYSFDPADSAYDSLSVGDSAILAIPITVTDDNGATDTTQIQITVTGTNDGPVAVDDAGTDEYSMSFDGSGDYIATNVNVPESDYSVSISFSTSTDGVGLYSVTNSDHGNAHDRHIYLDENGNLTARVWNNETIKTSGVDFSDGEEHTVVHVLDGDNQILYVDGEQLAIGDKGISDFDWDTRIEIGYSVDAPSDYFEGNISDVQIFDKALTSDEVQDLSNGEVIATDNLLMHYDFEGDTLAEQLSDKSGNGNDATGAGNLVSVVEQSTMQTEEDTSLVLNVDDLIANDTDVDGNDTLTLTEVNATGDTHGSVTLNNDGTITYVPDENYNGQAVFSYTVDDGNGGTDTATVTLDVVSVNDGPNVSDVSITVAEADTTISGQIPSTDDDAGSVAVFAVSAGSTTPDGFILNTDGSYSFDPSNDTYNNLNVGDESILTIPVTVTDDSGATDTAQIQITVSGTNDAPIAGADVVAIVDEGDATINGQLTSSDVDAGSTATFTITSGSAPDGFVLNIDGSYSFDPSDSTYDSLNVGDSSVLTIPVTVTDDNGATDTSQIQITVTGTNDAPVAGADVVANVNEGDSAINGQLTSSDVDAGSTATYTISSGSAPDGFVLNTDGSYSFDPSDSTYDSLNVGDSSVLTIPVTVTDDNGATDTSQIQITVSGTNDAPVAGADVVAAADEGDAAINGQLTSSDVDAGATATYTITSGSTPDGFILNSDGSYSFDPSDSSYDSLNVGDSSVLTIPVTVTDDNGETNTSQIQITISGTNDAPVAGAAVTATVDEGDSVINGQLTSSDVDAGSTATYTVSSGSVPDGFVLNADGSYSFDPADNAYDSLNIGDSSVLTIPVTVTDDNGATDTTQIQITVSGTNDSPIAGADVVANVNEGDSTINGQLTSNDVDAGSTATYTITSGSAPDGFVLNADGSYSFDPSDSTYDSLNVGDSSVLTVPVTVTDDNGATDTSQIQITVSGTNDAPVAGANVTTSVDEGDATINGQLTSSDVDTGSTATWSTDSSPDGFVLNSDGSYSFDPSDSAYDSLNIGDSSVLTIPVTVTDDNGATDISQIQITVSGTNDAPIAGADITSSVNEGDATINGQLTSSDVDAGATATFTISSGSAPDGFVLNTDGSYSFDPTDSAYDSLNVGDSSVITVPVTVTDDNGATDTSQIQITISGTNDAPIAGADITSSVNEGAATINGQLTSSDVDAGSTASYTITSGSPPDGFVLNTDGSYSFDPEDSTYDSLNVGDSSVLTIPVTVTDDNGATDTAQIQITVSGTNDSPVAGSDVVANVNEGDSAINGQLTSSDVDAGATATFTISSGSAPDGFVLNADGSYSFDPSDSTYDSLNVGDSSVLTIPVTVTDDNGATDTSQIQITVTGTNDAPVAGADVTTNVDEGDATINGQLTSSDVDAGSMATYTISSGSAPDGFVLNADGSYSFDPSDSAYDLLNVGDSNVLTIPVTVTDDNGATDTSQIQITVSGTNDAPIAGADVTVNVSEADASINGQLTSTDVDTGSTATWSTSSSPDGFVLNADGSYSFDPSDSAYDSLNVGDSSVITIPVTVTDDNGETDTAQIQITVSGTNDVPVAGANVTTSVDEGAATINGQLTVTDSDAGSTATYTITSGSAPDGFVLNTNGSYSFDPADSAYDSLNVGDSSVLTIPVTVTDDNGATDTTQIQITVSGTNDAPVAGASVTANVNEGASTINGQLTSTDVDTGATATFSITSGAAPDGFALNADGSYSFDPSNSTYDSLNVGDSSVLTIPVTVTDDNGATDTAQIKITVSGTNDAPIAGANITTSVDEGEAIINGQLTSSDIDAGSTATYSITSGGTPDGFVLNADGSYSFNPADASYDHLNVGDSEVLIIPVTVTDDNGATDTSQMQITVSGTNDSPTAIAMSSNSVDENSSSGTVVANLSATDVDDGETFTYTLTDSSGLFEIIGDQIVVKAGADIDFEASETHDISVLVTDSNGGTYSEDFTINVSDVIENANPDAVDDSEIDMVAQGPSLTVDLGDATIIGSDGPSTNFDNIIESATESYSGDSNNVITGSSGVDQVYIGDDNNQDINLGAGDDRLHIVDDTKEAIDMGTGDDIVRVDDDVTHTIDLGTGNDSIKVADDVSARIQTEEGNDFVIIGDHVWNVINGGDGVDSIELGGYSQTDYNNNVDNIQNNIQNFENIKFSDGTVIGDASAFDGSSNSASYEYPLTITAALNDNDGSESLSTTATLADLPVGTVVEIDGSTLTPDSDGNYSIDVSAGVSVVVTLTTTSPLDPDNLTFTTSVTSTESKGGDTATTTLTGEGTLDGDASINEVITTDEDVSLTLEPADLLANDTDADGDSLSITSVQDASNGSVVIDGSGNVVFTPDTNYNGEATFTYTISDGNGGTDTATVALNVQSVNDLPTDITLVGGTVIENSASGTVVADLSATDVDAGETFTYSLTDSSGLFEIVGSQIVVSAGADVDFEASETHDISVMVTDSSGGTYSENFTINVTDVIENNGTVTGVDESYMTYDTVDTAITGVLSSVDGVDVYTFTHNGGPLILDALTETSETDRWDNLTDSGGENYTEIDGDGSKSALDVMLEIKDSNGDRVAFNDDADLNLEHVGDAAYGYGDGSINGLDSYINLSDLPAGMYTIEVTSYNALSAGPYSISITGDVDLVENPFETSEDTALVIDSTLILSNDFDSDGDSLSITGIESVTNGTAIINGDGNVEFTPDAGYNGEATFVYNVSDNNGGYDSATVTLNVLEYDDSASSPTVAVSIGDAEIVSASNPDPTGHWKLDDTNSGGFDDSSGNGHTAINHADNSDDNRSGRFDRGLEIENNDYIEVAHSADLKGDSGSLTLWIDPDNNNGTYGLASSDSSGNDDGGHINLRMVNGELEFRMQDENDSYFASGGDVQGGWNQVTVTWGDDGMHVYLNGSEVASNAYTGGLSGNENPWTFGASQQYSGDDTATNLVEYFSGDLDEVAIFGEQLSASQVTELNGTDVETFAGDAGSGSNYSYELDVSATLTDTDGSEAFSSIVVSGIPASADLSAGTDNGDGTWNLDSDDLSGLMLTVPDTETAGFTLSVAATSTESNGGDTSTTTVTSAITPGQNAGPTQVNYDGGIGDDTFSGASNVVTAFGNDGNDTFVSNPLDGIDIFSGGDGGNWIDVIDVTSVVANDPSNPWIVEVNSVEVQYDLAAGALELNPDTAGVITFGDGSELTFDGVERIEW